MKSKEWITVILFAVFYIVFFAFTGEYAFLISANVFLAVSFILSKEDKS